MAAVNKRDGLRKTIRTLALLRNRLYQKVEENDEQLVEAMRLAYASGVSAIELAELTGIPRQNIYNWLRAGGDIELHHPKKQVAS